MKQKSAMQQLIDKLQSEVDRLADAKPNTDQWSYRDGIKRSITEAKKLLELEKQQIVDAYDNGWNNANNTPTPTYGKDYMAKTFEQ